MTDSEMLELAAKAAGIDYRDDNDYWMHQGHCAFWSYNDLCTCGARWNPLTDDGDALLAVTLGIGVQSYSGLGYSHAGIETVKKSIVVKELHDDGPYAATRRAIVKAAAEFGKA